MTVIKQLNNVFLQADNKLDVLQSLMFHNILVKKKAILDQFRKGLSILGLLDEIQRKPEMFEECFVYQGIVSNDSVASSLHFQPLRTRMLKGYSSCSRHSSRIVMQMASMIS